MEPSKYADSFGTESSINIVVGQNGAGKSRFLRKIAEESHDSGFNTLIVCNTPFDSFGTSKSRKKISIKSGVSLVERMLKVVIAGTYRQSKSRASNVGAVLEYCGYLPIVSIVCNGVNIDYATNVRTSEFKHSEDAYFEDIGAVAKSLKEGSRFTFDLSGGIVERFSNNETYRLLKLEKELKRRGVLSSIDIMLHKINGHSKIELKNASSGELSLIATLIFLITKIRKRSVIVIDEPENSLHPQWQREYVKRIYDTLYLYEPKIYMATHAPLIISGARAADLDVTVMKMDGDARSAMIVEYDNIEETMWELFGTITPESHYLSDSLVRTISMLKRGECNLDETLERITLMQSAAYDPKQIAVFSAATALSRKIAEEMLRA